MDSNLNHQNNNRQMPGSSVFLSQISLYILLLDFISKYEFSTFRVSAILTVVVSMISLFLFVNIKFFAQEKINALVASKVFVVGNLIFLFSILQAVVRSNGNQNTQQNILCFLLAYTSYLFSSRNPDPLYVQDSIKLIRLSCALASFVYLISCGFFGIGNSQIYFPRALSMISCLGLALTIPLLRDKQKKFFMLSTLFGVTVILSQSRTAIFVLLLTLLYVTYRQHRINAPRKWIHLFVALLGIYFLLTSKIVQDRFKFSGDQANFGGLKFNTAGRAKIWGLLLDKGQDSFLFGHGLGQSEDLIFGYFGTVAQPHNDYLRIFYDSGIIGLCAFFFVILGLFFWRIPLIHNSSIVNLDIPVLGKLVLIQFCIFMITDNPLVYPFYLMPVAFVLGVTKSHSATFSERNN